MRKFFVFSAVAALIAAGSIQIYASATHIGIVKSVVGQAQIIRGTESIAAEVNVKLLNGDLIETGLDGKIGLVFEDDTVVSMGPNSQFRIEEFLFQPADKKLSFIACMIHT